MAAPDDTPQHSCFDIYASLPVHESGTIRLLRLHRPSVDGGLLRCTLKTTKLLDRPKYYALSYTWGAPTLAAREAGVDGKRCRRIICNDLDLFITENLHHCLDYLFRSAFPVDHYWVDAICINQEDKSELSHQVNLMADIYQSADHILAWLGPEDEYTKHAFDLLRALGGLPERALWAIDPHKVHDQGINISQNIFDLTYWKALPRVFQRMWFNRVWIIQEVVLAKEVTVLCGQHSLAWNDFAKVSGFLTTSTWAHVLRSPPFLEPSAEALSLGVPTKLRAVKRDMEAKHGEVFLHSLLRARIFKATDPRDKVYSLLGIFRSSYGEDREKDMTVLYPDYKRAVNEVYIAAALSILKEVDDLLILAHAEGEDFQPTPGIPSWVPDWSVEKILGLGVTGYKRFAAAGNLPRRIDLERDEGVIAVYAAELDTIVQVGESKEDVHNTGVCKSWLQLISELDPTYHTGQSRLEVFWRTLITDTAGAPPKHPTSEDLGPAFKEWLLLKTGAASRQMSPEMDQTLHQLDKLTQRKNNSIVPIADEVVSLTRLSDWNTTRQKAAQFDVPFSHALHLRLFRTSQGFLGLGSQSLKPGDSVWIVPGSRVPLIMRSASDRPRFKLVGATYLHGFMRGEALRPKSLTFRGIELE